jgi:hypothetical protein
MMTTTQSGSDKSTTRCVKRVVQPGSRHWVGDGFFVSSVIDPQMDSTEFSPFLLLDHATPQHFDPAAWPRGVGEHPHRGFETVTFAYQGEVEHRDSGGGGGLIGPGDVQWMTAASGVVHEEKHSKRFAETGGTFEMVQLWVNLPAAKKMSSPNYQSLLDTELPRIRLGAAEARLVTGSLCGQTGPAETQSPITIFDLRFLEGGTSSFTLPVGWTTLALPLEGQLGLEQGGKPAVPVVVPEAHLLVFERNDDGMIRLHAKAGSRVLVLAGLPLNEPVAAYGPFVMNTREELRTAFDDYNSGHMGHLSVSPGRT